jgi:transposase
MNTLPKIYVGIDVSKKYLDIHILPLEKSLRITNSKHGIKLLQKQIAQFEVGQIAFESTGGYECHLFTELKDTGYKLWQVDPKRIKAFIVSEGIKAKTDKIDARMIALFASSRQPNYQPIQLSATEEKLRALNKRRTDLLRLINMESNRLNHPQQIHCNKIIKRHISFMEKQILEIEAELNLLIKNDEAITKKIEIYKSVPGIGNVVATTLAAEMPELGKISHKKIAALLGLAPFIQQSGMSKGTACIRGGRSYVRKTIYMAALVATQYNPALKEFYNRLCKSGKKPKVALVAVMRKLIVILNAMLLKGETWCVN